MIKQLTLFLVILSSIVYGQERRYAEDGVLDLSEWNPTENPYFEIHGEWEFYFERHIAPWDYSDEDSAIVKYRNCTSAWNTYEDDLPSFGFATYRLHLKNIPDQELNLLIRSVTCAVSVYANDELIAEIGQVGTKPELEEQRYEERVVSLPHGKKDVTLTIFLSNWEHRNGGLNNPWYIGTEDALYEIHRKHIMVNGIEFATFLFAGLFFITLYIWRKKDKALLYFALYCLTFCTRPLISVNYMIMSVWPDINWNFMVHAEYMTLFIPAAFMLLFLREHFKDQAPRKFLNVMVILIFLEALITLVTPIHIFTWLPIPHQLVTFVNFALVGVIVARALRDKASGAVFGGIAILCLIMSSTYVLLLYLDMIPPMPYSYTALQMAFLLSMSMILGSKFAGQFRKVEYLMVETEQQKVEIEEQHQILELKNEEITSSITYARRIQNAILPSNDTLKNAIPESFILYKPKDIVAGDFYWAERKDDLLFLAAADCTGHGVPGAMVSVVCNSALNRCIREFNLTDPGQILDKARELVIETFEQSKDEVKDGMDIALIVLDLKTNKVQFSGANNPVWIVRNLNNPSNVDASNAKTVEQENIQLVEIKGNKQPIGIHFNPQPFTTHEFELSQNEWVYLFSDGYADQFGGDKGKKFMYKPMKKMVMDLFTTNANQQKETVDTSFVNWKGEMEQTDDVCMIGFKL